MLTVTVNNGNEIIEINLEFKELSPEKLEESRKRLLSIGTWDEESIKLIEEVRENFSKWSPQEF